MLARYAVVLAWGAGVGAGEGACQKTLPRSGTAVDTYKPNMCKSILQLITVAQQSKSAWYSPAWERQSAQA
jgi:hypothetical protein